MPNYIYKCSDCNLSRNVFMSISQYKNNANNIECAECGSKPLARAYGFSDGIVEVSPDEKLKNIRAEAKSEAKKIISGNISAIHNIYGS